jgi:hypothetical protein
MTIIVTKKILKNNQIFIYIKFILKKFHPFQNHLQFFFDSSSKFISFSRNSIKLDGDLHPTLGSLSQFFVHKY